MLNSLRLRLTHYLSRIIVGDMLVFFVIATGSQIIFAFYAIRSVLYIPLIEALGVNHAEFGALMSLTGLGVLFSGLLAFVQKLLSVRFLLTAGLTVNGVGAVLISVTHDITVLYIIFALMGFVGMGVYWPSVLSAVRCLTAPQCQGQGFSLLELMRRITELVMNGLCVALFVLIGNLYGIRTIAFILGVVMLISAAMHWRLLRFTHHSIASNKSRKESIQLMLQAAKMKEVWLVGFMALGVYVCYVGMQYFLPFINQVYDVSVVNGALFALVNVSVIGIIAATFSGFLADNVFRSPTRFLVFILIITLSLLGLLLIVPHHASWFLVVITVAIVFTFAVYLARSIYFAPIGEFNISPDLTGCAMAIAAFIGYSPMFFAYSIFGSVIDNFEHNTAYNLIFTIMFGFALLSTLCGVLLLVLKRKNARTFL